MSFHLEPLINIIKFDQNIIKVEEYNPEGKKPDVHVSLPNNGGSGVESNESEDWMWKKIFSFPVVT